jgi:Fe-S cluster assembly protein SufB
MPTETSEIETLANREYKWGFITDIEADSAPPGLNEEIIRFISHKKGEPEWMLEWRLKAYRHWLTMDRAHMGDGSSIRPSTIRSTIYYSAPKPKLKSLDEVDPELLATTKSSAFR